MTVAFRHPRRLCHWCSGAFRPTDTLSPRSNEHFCSAECAFANHTAKARELFDPGAYRALKTEAVQERAQRGAEIVARLRDGRERAKAKRGVYSEWCHDPALCAGKGYCPRDPTCGD